MQDKGTEADRSGRLAEACRIREQRQAGVAGGQGDAGSENTGRQVRQGRKRGMQDKGK
jgi:hypothetical protein